MNQSSKGFTLIELMIVVAIVALLSAIATARFAVSQARSRQSEAMTNLKSMFAAEKAFRAEKGHFSGLVHEIGFSPERNNRYAYFAGLDGTTLEDRRKAAIAGAATDYGIEYDSFKYGLVAPFTTAINAAPAASPCGTGLPGISGVASPVWTGMAQGQVDNDPTLDLWSISTGNRTAAAAPACASSGANNPAGEPLVETNDVDQ